MQYVKPEVVAEDLAFPAIYRRYGGRGEKRDVDPPQYAGESGAGESDTWAAAQGKSPVVTALPLYHILP